MDLYAELLRNNMIDGIVATGASIVDMDFFEGLGHKHYQALEVPDDDTLRSLLIDRIYDTYIDEEQLQDCDHTILEIANSLEPKAYSSRAFIREMGKYLVEHGKKDNSLVKLAYEHDVPIFCPAFVDSSAGFGLVKHQVDRAKEGKPYMVLDAIADFRELTDIKIKAGTTGAADDRRRRAQEFHPGHGGVRRNPRPRRCPGSQICRADHRCRRARRGVFILDAAGGGELGQGQHRHRIDGLRRSWIGDAAAGERRLSPGALEGAGPSGHGVNYSLEDRGRSTPGDRPDLM